MHKHTHSRNKKVSIPSKSTPISFKSSSPLASTLLSPTSSRQHPQASTLTLRHISTQTKHSQSSYRKRPKSGQHVLSLNSSQFSSTKLSATSSLLLSKLHLTQLFSCPPKSTSQHTISSRRHFATTHSQTSEILPNPLHTSSQIRTLFPQDYDENVGFDPHDPKLSNPPQRLSTDPGLWGLRGLKTPNDFDSLYLDKVYQIQARAQRLLFNPTTGASLQLIDDISRLLCDIADLSEAIRINHNINSWTQKANSVHQSVQDLLGGWSSSPIVLMTLFNIIRTKEIWENLPLEGRRIVLDLIGRMNMNTIISAEDYELIPPRIYNAEESFAYSEEADANWITIPSSIAETLTTEDKLTLSRFSQAFKFRPIRPSFLTTSPNYDFKQDEDHDESKFSKLTGFLSRKRNSLQSSTDSLSLPVAFRNSADVVQNALLKVSNGNLRRLLYKYRDLSYQNRLTQLQDLLKYRHIFSLCQGQLSYAHSVNSSHLSKTPNVPIKTITTFLDNLTKQRIKEYTTMSKVLNKLESHYEIQIQDQMNKKYGKTAIETKVLKKSLEAPSSGQNISEINASNTETKLSLVSPRLHMSDIPFIIQSISSATNSSVQNELPSYLQLDSVLQGVGLVCNVMDVQLEAHVIRSGEGWGNKSHDPNPHFTTDRIKSMTYATLEQPHDTTGIPKHALTPSYVTNSTYHHGVHKLKQPGTWCMIQDIDLTSNHHLISGSAFKLHFVDKSSQDLLGVLYIDPYDSKNKQGGGAQYVVCSGRMAHEYTDQPPTKPHINHPSTVDPPGSQFNQNGERITPTTQIEFETPTTFLTTSIPVQPPIVSSHTDGKLHVKLPQLSYDNVRLLFHEIGHAFHTIKSRTQFQHYSGSRCEMDFVEMPSTLFEIVSQDPKFIKLFAKHHLTGQPLPQHLYDAIAIQQTLFPTHKVTQTGLLSLLDLRLFGPQSPIESIDDVINPFKHSLKLATATQKATQQIEVDATQPNGVLHTSKTIKRHPKTVTLDDKMLHVIEKDGKLKNGHPKDNNHDNNNNNNNNNNNQNSTDSASFSSTQLNYDQFRPETILLNLYKSRGYDIDNPNTDPNLDTTSLMENILDTFDSPHNTPEQTILQAHAIYRRYGNIDIHEHGPGVMFHDIELFNQIQQENESKNKNEPRDKINAEILRKHFKIQALTDKSPSYIYPHAEHTHLSHYGGFYFSYLYCRAFATIVKKRVFDPLLEESQARTSSSSSSSSSSPSSSDGESTGKNNLLNFDSISSIAEFNQRCGGMEHRKKYLDVYGKSMFDFILPTTRNGVDFRFKVLQPGGSQSGLDILAELLISPEERQSLAQKIPNSTEIQENINTSSTQQYNWPKDIFNTPFDHTSTGPLLHGKQSPSDITYNTIGILRDDFLGQEQLDHRETEKTRWNEYLSTLCPDQRDKLPSYPPHSSDLSLIYSTLTEFQHHVGWKTPPHLPASNEESDQENYLCNGDNSTPGSKSYDFSDPMMAGLTPLQQRVLQLSFETFEQDTIEKSEQGLKHIMKTFSF